MKAKKNKVFKVVAAVLIIVAAYSVYHLLRGREIALPSLFLPAPGSRLILSMDGFKSAQSERGRVTWRMDSRKADLYENKEARLQDVEIIFKNPGKGDAVLIGETGIMNTTSGNATIRGDSREVRIVTSDGYLLTTNSLNWNTGERVVRTADPFKLLGREIYLEGRGITAKVDDNTIVVENNVKAVLQE
jgi:LPS export ABC transporter protein LptC